MLTPMAGIDETHDPQRRSWLESANGPTDFPIQNLPFGVFRRSGSNEGWRGGVAIGEAIVDLARLRDARVLAGDAAAALAAAAEPSLNRYMSLGSTAWSALRRALSRLLAADDPHRRDNQAALAPALVEQADAVLTVAADVGDYTDFYTSYHHALNGGRINRPSNPLPPSFKHVPIGYHGRASTIVVSGTPVRRPLVQSREGEREAPEFGPCRMLDYEGELAFHVGPGNAQGEPIPVARIHEHLFGCSILNDWSARDAQRWESFVAGPLLAKNFATSVSPWIVTTAALAPFRVPAPVRPPGDPAALPYLDAPTERDEGAFDIVIEVALLTEAMRNDRAPPYRISRARFREQYFTIGQMAAHHASNGCRLRPGDIIATGTVSNEEPGSWGSLMENTQRGKVPLVLPNGEARGFLADGDDVIIRARCERAGFVAIGFGECRGRVLAAPAATSGIA
jgi:fumarylacetoacetase